MTIKGHQGDIIKAIYVSSHTLGFSALWKQVMMFHMVLGSYNGSTNSRLEVRCSVPDLQVLILLNRMHDSHEHTTFSLLCFALMAIRTRFCRIMRSPLSPLPPGMGITSSSPPCLGPDPMRSNLEHHKVVNTVACG